MCVNRGKCASAQTWQQITQNVVEASVPRLWFWDSGGGAVTARLRPAGSMDGSSKLARTPSQKQTNKWKSPWVLPERVSWQSHGFHLAVWCLIPLVSTCIWIRWHISNEVWLREIQSGFHPEVWEGFYKSFCYLASSLPDPEPASTQSHHRLNQVTRSLLWEHLLSWGNFVGSVRMHALKQLSWFTCYSCASVSSSIDSISSIIIGFWIN